MEKQTVAEEKSPAEIAKEIGALHIPPTAPPVPVTTGEPETKPRPRPGPPRNNKKRPAPDLEQFINLAKKMAVQNYNASRDPSRNQAIDESQVYIAGFSKVMSHWKATVVSPVARNLLWEVTFNAAKNQVYVDAYRKISNSMKQLGEDGE
jgi:hypothetical protein